MSLQLIQPREKYLLPHTTFRDAILERVRLVLRKYLGEPGYSKFYVGITHDVNRRLQEHQRTKPEYRWMIPIYEEVGVPHPDGFDQLEQLAIRTFGPKHGTAFTHPNAPPGRTLIFDNRRENSPPQTTFYVLIG
ncbi:MAG TPA: hypothetical protein VGD56_15735 [Gemmatirosa sp.]